MKKLKYKNSVRNLNLKFYGILGNSNYKIKFYLYLWNSLGGIQKFNPKLTLKIL